MKITCPACRIVASKFSWTPRVLSAHAAQSRDLAEGRWNQSVARRARCAGVDRQRGALEDRPDSNESWRPARTKRPKDSKAASRSSNLSVMAAVVRKQSFFGRFTKCTTCSCRAALLNAIWLNLRNVFLRLLVSIFEPRSFNNFIHRFVAWEFWDIKKMHKIYEK